jgi:regulatory protein
MVPYTMRKTRPALDPKSLDELALRYVGRFATSRAKLRSYLQRKISERGWVDDPAPDLDRLVERLAGLGYVDDRSFALAKASSLSARGYGKRRVGEALRLAGIAEEEGAEARILADSKAAESALHFAKRRRFGPFAQCEPDRHDREKALASMLRAGHSLKLSRTILSIPPGTPIEPEELADPEI